MTDEEYLSLKQKWLNDECTTLYVALKLGTNLTVTRHIVQDWSLDPTPKGGDL